MVDEVDDRHGRERHGVERDGDHLSALFAALADPTRGDMVTRLAASDATVGELAEPYEMSMQAVSKHLKVLEDAGLVTKTKDAQRRTVRLDADVFDLMTKWIERYRGEAEARYRRLDQVLAEMTDAGAPDPIAAATERVPDRVHDRAHTRARKERSA